MAKQFVKGNIYVFIAKKVGGSPKNYIWESDINGHAVTIESKDKAFIGVYGILPEWCKCIKNNN